MKLTIIDPIDDMRLIEYIQLKNTYKNCAVFRCYTLIMYGTPLDNLIPFPDLLQLIACTPMGDESTKEFDIAYANQLLNNPPSFIDLMQLMTAFQDTEEVFLISNYKHPIVASILDSLIKFIQERYSIRPLIVNDIEDIDELALCDFQSQRGYDTLIQDIDRFKRMYYTKEQLENDVKDF